MGSFTFLSYSTYWDWLISMDFIIIDIDFSFWYFYTSRISFIWKGFFCLLENICRLYFGYVVAVSILRTPSNKTMYLLFHFRNERKKFLGVASQFKSIFEIGKSSFHFSISIGALYIGTARYIGTPYLILSCIGKV